MRDVCGSVIRRQNRRVFRAAGVLVFSVSACAGAADPASRGMKAAEQAQLNGASPGIDQIGDGVASVGADQIGSVEWAQGLTVAQLRAYTDRCAPDAKNPLPAEDCSNIRLMLGSSMRSDDEIARALAILNRLSRP